MFGYMTTNYKALSKEEQAIYQQYYCGLCRALQQRFGNLSRLTLNNDMTFLLMLLSSLYELSEDAHKGRCLTHPLKARAYRCSELCAFCADMTILLSYQKLLDDRMDDGSLRSRAGVAVLEKQYRAVQSRYPEKTEHIEGYLREITAYEKSGGKDIDVPINLSGKLLGEVFRYRDDAFAEDLQALGEGLGRFVYLMDAYDDLPADIRKGRYNALRTYQAQDDYHSFVEDSLLMMIAECTQIFETLPLEKHLSILRNVLYSGVWMRSRQQKGRKAGNDA